MKETQDLNLEQYISMTSPGDGFKNELIIRKIEFSSAKEQIEQFPVRLNAYSTLVVLKGEMDIEMNCQSYHLPPASVMEMGIGNIVEEIRLSPDFEGYHILINHDLLKEVINPISSLFPGNTIKLKHLYPTRVLESQELQDLLDIIHRLEKYIADKAHFYHEQRIKNELGIWIMELNYSLWKRHGGEGENVPGYHTLKERFRHLLHQHCKEQHEVSFYAAQLCVTPDYLSKVMRDFSGRSAAKWINHALVTEAKILLRKPDITLLKITEILHFSDQSAFGKFFKKHTGLSPVNYRKGKKKQY